MSVASPPVPLGDDPWRLPIRSFAEGVRNGLAALGVAEELESLVGQVELSDAPGVDLAFPTHRYAKALRQDPQALAEALARALPPAAWAGPPRPLRGFVNLAAEPTWLARATLEVVLAPAPRAPTTGPEGTVCVEHTSANPTGPFHMGRVRNGIIGDSVARVLRAAGHRVTTQYYVDDVGRQAAMITWIWSKPLDHWPAEIRATVDRPEAPPVDAERPDRELGRPYPAVSAYLKTHPEAAGEVAELSRRLEQGSAPPDHRRFGEAILRGMVASLARIGISFDEFVWESTFLHDGSVDDVVARLRRAPHVVSEENGALAIDATGYGLPKESGRIVVLRADGTTLYATRDLAYHGAKFRRFDRVLDVLGQDHRLHARTLDALLQEIAEPRRAEFLIYQDITVPEGGRMSTRKGSAVWLDELLDEAERRAAEEVRKRRPEMPEEELARIARAVAAGAVRYHILRVAPEKTVGFRWEDAMAFEGRSGPFLQYAYARASSILRKGDATDGPWAYDAPALADADSQALLRVLSRGPRTIEYAARTGHVHAVAGLAYEVAEGFNRFYEKVPVLTAGAALPSRLALVAAARRSLGRLLGLCGIDALDAM